MNTEDFRVLRDQRVDLGEWPTRAGRRAGGKHGREILAALTARLDVLQSLLYASDSHALLLIFQGMDSSGKDSAIKHVMSGVNPQGCQVTSFKHPSASELEHDFLWRATRSLPQRGQIGIFNRSHYEEVLNVKVRPKILAAQRLPIETREAEDFWSQRYQSIVELEEHLARNGTRIVKFFMHLSRDEQRLRLLRRLEDPARYWKFSPDDLEQRRFWDAYQRAYAECLSATSTDAAPWYVVPADDKRSAHRLISQVLVELLEGLQLQLPEPDPARKAQLLQMRRRLRG